MPRGIRFDENIGCDFFRYLDTLMDVTQYTWYIDDVDFNYFFYRDGIYNGNEFKDAIDEEPRWSFARIRRYPVGVMIDSIDEYEDYAKSDCDLLILFYDGGFFEIYVKNARLLSTFYDLCSSLGFKTLEYIDDFDEDRSYMHY